MNPLEKNDPLPEVYRSVLFQYTRTRFGVILRKNISEVFLCGDDETQFFRECNRAKQKGSSISKVIDEYF
jgi:hypothetical protein